MIIEKLDGARIDLADFDCRLLKLFIPSISPRYTISPVDGRAPIITNANFEQREIRAEILIKSRDINDYYLLRDELNALFISEEPFYIIHKKQRYKRWKVRLSSSFEAAPRPRLNTFMISFLCENIYAESVATSLDLQEKRTWDIGLWGFGSGINVDEEYKYSFNTNEFTVKNIGNAIVDPRESMLEIGIKGSFASKFTLTNHATNEVYQFDGSLQANDELKIMGVRTFKNGVSAFKQTNKKLISLISGDNSFSITNGTIHSIVFNFRFLYM